MFKWNKLLLAWIGFFLAFSYIPTVASGDWDGEGTCDPGQYFDLDLVSCMACEVGNYSADGMGTSCLPCDVWTYQPDMGASECIPCAAWTYIEFTQSSSCNACPNGMISEEGATSCTPCGPDMTSNEAGTACLALYWRNSSIAEGKFITDSDSDIKNTSASPTDADQSPLSSYTLSESEKTKVSNFVEKIKIFIQLNRSPDSMYENTITLLESYLTLFSSQGDTRKLALAEELLTHLKSLFSQN